MAEILASLGEDNQGAGSQGSRRPVRILIFAPHFAEYASRLAAALGTLAEVLVVTEAANTRAECQGLSIGCDEPRLSRATYRSRYAWRTRSIAGFVERWRLRRTIRAFAPDVVHIQEQGDDLTASIAEELGRRHPLVVTVHDPVPHSGNDALVAARFAGGLARIRAVADAFHVHGTYCETALRERLKTRKPVAATAHGVILVPRAGERRGDGDRFLFFGRMEAYKGLDVLLDAIDLLPDRHGLRFVLAGRGPELDRLRRRIAAQAAIEVVDRFLPPLDAIAQFRRARAVVVPYRDATQSGVISAAVGNGVPVIASRVGGLVDAVGEGRESVCGLLVAPGDPTALAAALLEMADDVTHRRLTEGAQAAAGGRFAWNAVAMKLYRLYGELLAERGAS